MVVLLHLCLLGMGLDAVQHPTQNTYEEWGPFTQANLSTDCVGPIS